MPLASWESLDEGSVTPEYEKSKVERLPRIPPRNFWEEDEDVDDEGEDEDEADRTNNPPTTASMGWLA